MALHTGFYGVDDPETVHSVHIFHRVMWQLYHSNQLVQQKWILTLSAPSPPPSLLPHCNTNAYLFGAQAWVLFVSPSGGRDALFNPAPVQAPTGPNFNGWDRLLSAPEPCATIVKRPQQVPRWRGILGAP